MIMQKARQIINDPPLQREIIFRPLVKNRGMALLRMVEQPRPDILFEAAMKLIAKDQRKHFGANILHHIKHGVWQKGSDLANINAMVDSMGVLRVYGRLRSFEEITGEMRHPIILPKSMLTRTIIAKEHEMKGHQFSAQNLFAHLSTKFWSTHLKKTVKDVCRKCVTCQKRTAKPAQQFMADMYKLPQNMSSRAFTFSSMDYAGPFYLKQSRKTSKAYLLITVCKATKACDIQPVSSLDTDDFLLALTIIAKRRGPIYNVRTDNGSNFIKANRLLLREGKQDNLWDEVSNIDWDKVRTASPEFGIMQWTWSPAHSPESNGLAEAFVRLAKKAMYDQFRHRSLTRDQFNTVAVCAEDLINRRPIGINVQSDWHQSEVLTPLHFLTGRRGPPPTPEDVERENLAKRWQCVKEAERQLDIRWRREILPTLHSRKKWQDLRKNMQKGDMVLIVNKQRDRHEWPLGKVDEIFRSDDGLVREAKVLAKFHPTQTMMIYTRHVRQLVPIRLFQTQDEDGTDSN